MSRIARLPDEKREDCDSKHAEGSDERGNCYKTHANAEFGGVQGESCNATGSKCDVGLNLCCGVAKPEDAKESLETEAIKLNGLKICDRNTSDTYFHTPDVENATTE